MKESKKERQEMQEQSPWSVLEKLARKGAREMPAKAMEPEVAEFVEKHKDKIGGDGHRLVVRNGYMEERFNSKILPRHMRRVPSVNNPIPMLYLKGGRHGGFLWGPGSDTGYGYPWAECDEYRGDEVRVGAGISQLVPAGSEARSGMPISGLPCGRYSPVQPRGSRGAGFTRAVTFWTSFPRAFRAKPGR